MSIKHKADGFVGYYRQRQLSNPDKQSLEDYLAKDGVVEQCEPGGSAEEQAPRPRSNTADSRTNVDGFCRANRAHKAASGGGKGSRRWNF